MRLLFSDICLILILLGGVLMVVNNLSLSLYFFFSCYLQVCNGTRSSSQFSSVLLSYDGYYESSLYTIILVYCNNSWNTVIETLESGSFPLQGTVAFQNNTFSWGLIPCTTSIIPPASAWFLQYFALGSIHLDVEKLKHCLLFRNKLYFVVIVGLPFESPFRYYLGRII